VVEDESPTKKNEAEELVIDSFITPESDGFALDFI